MVMEEWHQVAPTAEEVNAIKDPLAKALEEGALARRDGTAVEEHEFVTFKNLGHIVYFQSPWIIMLVSL